MQDTQTNTQRRARFVKTVSGLAYNDEPDGHALIPQPQDFALLETLDPERRYQYLSRDCLHALHGGEFHNFRKRLDRMSRKPYKWLERPFQQLTANHLYKATIFTRGDNGDRLLIQHGRLLKRADRRPQNFHHELLNDLFDVSLEVSIKSDPSLQYLYWTKILEHPATPAFIKSNPTPFTISVGDGKKFRPDGRPFVIRRTLQDGSTRAIAFLKEIDCHNEQLSYSAKKDNTFDDKLSHYDIVFKQKLYEKQYGFPAAMVIIITTSERHMRNMMDHAEKIIGPKIPWLLFKTMPDHQALGVTVPILPAMLREPYQRVGFPPFSLATLEAVP